MGDQEVIRSLRPLIKVVYAAVGVTAAVLVLGATLTVAPRQAQALPTYAAQTGFPCGKCHINPAGGGDRNSFGKAFAANGHKLPGKKK